MLAISARKSHHHKAALAVLENWHIGRGIDRRSYFFWRRQRDCLPCLRSVPRNVKVFLFAVSYNPTFLGGHHQHRTPPAGVFIRVSPGPTTIRRLEQCSSVE